MKSNLFKLFNTTHKFPNREDRTPFICKIDWQQYISFEDYLHKDSIEYCRNIIHQALTYSLT